MVMKNLNTAILDLEGNPVVVDKKPRIMRKVFVEALTASFPSEQMPGQEVSGAVKSDRWDLAVRITAEKGEEFDFTPEELVMLKDVVGKGFGPMIVGPVFKFLDE